MLDWRQANQTSRYGRVEAYLLYTKHSTDAFGPLACNSLILYNRFLYAGFAFYCLPIHLKENQKETPTKCRCAFTCNIPNIILGRIHQMVIVFCSQG